MSRRCCPKETHLHAVGDNISLIPQKAKEISLFLWHLELMKYSFHIARDGHGFLSEPQKDAQETVKMARALQQKVIKAHTSSLGAATEDHPNLIRLLGIVVPKAWGVGFGLLSSSYGTCSNILVIILIVVFGIHYVTM